MLKTRAFNLSAISSVDGLNHLIFLHFQFALHHQEGILGESLNIVYTWIERKIRQLSDPLFYV